LGIPCDFYLTTIQKKVASPRRRVDILYIFYMDVSENSGLGRLPLHVTWQRGTFKHLRLICVAAWRFQYLRLDLRGRRGTFRAFIGPMYHGGLKFFSSKIFGRREFVMWSDLMDSLCRDGFTARPPGLYLEARCEPHVIFSIYTYK